jgi:RES domain-containing protein
VAEGRYHREGAQPPLYASTTADASWGELFRHFSDGGDVEVSPFEIKRVMSTLEVRDLPVLDLTDELVRKHLDVSEQDLIGNSYAVCQAIADLVASSPSLFGGILAPSAVIPEEQTLVVFAGRIFKRDDHVRVDPARTRAGTPPRDLFDLFEHVIDSLPAMIQSPLRRLAAQIKQDWSRIS